jgi:hypothetical protein
MMANVASAVRFCREKPARNSKPGPEPEDALIQALAEIYDDTNARCDHPDQGEVDEQAVANRMQKIVRHRSKSEDEMMGELPPPARYVRRPRAATPAPSDKRRLLVTCNNEGQGPPLPPVRVVRWGGGKRKARTDRPPEPDTQFEIEIEMASDIIADRQGKT